jgi:cytochrome P450
VTFSEAGVRADRRLFRAAHPVAYPLVRALDRLGPAARVPGLGVVVNDPDLVRAVLVDGERFRKDGPGSPGALWTPVVGRRALTNLDGAEHRELRTALAPRFTPAAVAALVAEAAADPLPELAAALRRGEAADVVATARALAGSVVCRLVGAPATGEDAARLAAAGERLTASIRLGTRRLGARTVERARTVLAGVGDPAAASGALGLPADDARAVAGVLLLTGTETVISFLPRLVALLARSGRLAPGTVAGTLEHLDALLDAALRVTVPTPVTLRRSVAATRVGPVAVRPEDRLLVLTLNAVRSGAPEGMRQLWFGAGPHFCLGRPVALAEASALVRALAEVVLGTGRPLRVVRGRPARGVLLPAWRELQVAV